MDNEKINKEINLYRKNQKGDIVLKTVSRGMYKDSDSFQEALDHFSAEGFYDNYEDAKEETKPELPTINKFKF